MIELYISQNKNTQSEAYGKYYPRVSYKQTMNIHDMAVHMAEHNTPFSEGTIEGILRDFVKCVREQTLNGNTVKVDNLAIFKVSVIGNGCKELYDADLDKTITASIGTIGRNDKTGPAVNSLKLLAQATGEYTREELNKDGKLGWTDKAAAEILAAKNAAMGNSGGSSSGGSSDNNGGSQNGGTQSGGDNSGQQGQQGDQNQQSGYALTIATSGSGTATVTHDGNAVTSGATLNEDDEVEISITPAEGQVPTASINSSAIELTEDNGVYTGSFAMPGQASALVISTGVSGEGGDGGEGLDKD